MEKNPSQKSRTRVLDLSMFWAGATCAELLGEMGMEVIKIESCKHPDPDRIVTQGLLYLNNELGDAPWNRGMLNLRRHRNKLGITLDLSCPEGRDIFLKLVKISDIVIENFRMGVMEKLGIAYHALEKINPKIILVSVSSQGETGPERTYGSNAEILAFTSGVRSISDYEDEIGMFTATNIPDPLAGTVAAGIALGALRHGRRSGKGMHVIISQRELLTSCIGDVVMDYSMNGRVPEPQGNAHDFFAPHGCYPCEGRDSWIAIVVRNDDEWESFCTAMNMSELINDPRFATGLSRWHNRAELDGIIAARTATYERKRLTDILQDKNVAASALLSVPDLVEDRHLKERGYWDRINDPRPSFGEYICKGKGFSLSKTPMKTDARAPDLGEHNAYVYGELLGMSDEDLKTLEDKGIMGTTPAPEVVARIPKTLPKAHNRTL
ncbi:MAG TPA: CoA transferase [Syntrophorhabdaceae bacterium]|nr:CoA transferase [Syntrophorhabdaceae bacterium]